jgi:hypothetical protein
VRERDRHIKKLLYIKNMPRMRGRIKILVKAISVGK